MFANLAAWSLFPAQFGDKMHCVMTCPEKEKTIVSHSQIQNSSSCVKRHNVFMTQLKNSNEIQIRMFTDQA